MNPDERLAVQRVVMDWLQQDATENPTRLIDILLSGDGWQFVHHVVSTRAAYARGNAEAMDHLLRVLNTERLPPPAPAQPTPPPAPPTYMPPTPGVPRSE